MAWTLVGCAPVASLAEDAGGDSAVASDAASVADGTPAGATVCGDRNLADRSPDAPDDPYYNPANCTTATPVTAANETWTWAPVDDAVCGDGTSTGLGFNLTNRSEDVVIFLNGGGACWDALTCLGLGTAVHVNDGYNASTFRAESIARAPFFSRTDAHNPFRDASYVFVPYCTGDAHGGRAVKVYTDPTSHGRREVYFMGARNMDVYLRRIVATFPHARRVWLMGMSAGGFGAGLHWDRVQSAFGDAVRVDLVDDSGPPIEAPPARLQLFRDAWHLEIPTGCTSCASSLDSLVDYYAARYPTHRMALLSYTQDSTITFFMGLAGPTDFETRLDALRDHFTGHTSVGYYFWNGTSHTLLGQMNVARPDGQIVLADWLKQMTTDDPAWASSQQAPAMMAGSGP